MNHRTGCSFMKLLSDTVVEIDYFQLMDAVQQYFRSRCLGNAKVSWIVPCQDVAEGLIPYQGSYRVKMTWAAEDYPGEGPPQPMNLEQFSKAMYGRVVAANEFYLSARAGYCAPSLSLQMENPTPAASPEQPSS